MAVIHIPRRTYRQPQGRVTIDPSFFLAESLVLAVDPATLIDYVSGSLPTNILRGGTTSVGAGTNGRALVGANGWVAAAYDDQRYGDATGPLSFFGLANITALDTWGGVVSVSDGSGNASFSFQRHRSGTAFYVSRANIGGFVSAVGAVTSLINASEVPMLVATSGGATPVDVRVGSDTYSGTSTGGTSTASGVRYLNIFAERSRTASFGGDGRFLLATFFNKFVTADEWGELSRNPWQLFRSEPRRIYSFPTGPILIPAAGAVSTASLTAPSGASTASTTASGFVAVLSLSAPTGTSSTFVSVTATGAISALTVSAPAAAAATVSVASGALDTLTLTAPTGASTTASEITASGGFSPMSLSAPVGSAAVISSVTGVFAQILLTAPTGTSSTVVEVSATGQVSALALTEPFGNTAVSALLTGAFVEISLSAPSAKSGTGSLEELVYQLLANRQELDPVLGEFIIYDVDGITIKWRAKAWEDANATLPYRGGALTRIDKLELQ